MSVEVPLAGGVWDRFGRIVAAHSVMLRDVGLIDDDALAGLLRAADSTRLAGPGADRNRVSLLEVVRDFDVRMDAQLPAGLAGTARVGRGTIDVAAGVARVILRGDVLRFGDAVIALRTTLIELANTHVVSLMPVSIAGHIAQPTTLGHVLTSLVSQLARTAARIESAYADVNCSPLGSGALASTGMPIDRERLTDLLGFDGLIENTFDAVSATDHFAGIAEAVESVVLPVKRFLDAILTWVRAEPESFRFGAKWTGLLSDLPQARPVLGIESLIGDLQAAIEIAVQLRSVAGRVAFGPHTIELDRLLEFADAALSRGSSAIDRANLLIGGGL